MAVSQRVTSSPIFTGMAAGRLIRIICYWVFTIFIAWEMALGAYWDLFQTPYVRNVFTHLHLPSYFLIVMGIWKLPCAVILLTPGATRMKEWAYAGIVFAMIGAALSQLLTGNNISTIIAPALFIILIFISWSLRPPDRTLKKI